MNLPKLSEPTTLSGGSLKIGVSLTSFHAGHPRAALGNLLQRVAAAREAGLDHLTFGDHHAVGPSGSYLQGVPLLARSLAEWPCDRQTGLLFLVPLWHPVMMAEFIGTLASMSDRPLIVQTGIGGGRAQFAAIGAALRSRGRETDRRIAAVKGLLAGHTVTDDALGIHSAAIGPVPSEPVEWWIGSGDATAAIQRAAAEGDALYISPSGVLEEVTSLVAAYRRRCDDLGRPARVVLRRDCVLSTDASEARTIADELTGSGYRGMRRGAVIAGNVNTVAADFTKFAAAGVDDIAVRCLAVPQDVALETITLLGEVRLQLG